MTASVTRVNTNPTQPKHLVKLTYHKNNRTILHTWVFQPGTASRRWGGKALPMYAALAVGNIEYETKIIT